MEWLSEGSWQVMTFVMGPHSRTSLTGNLRNSSFRAHVNTDYGDGLG